MGLVTTQSTIVFDLDGTLADSIHDLVAALNRTIERRGLAPFNPSDIAYLTGHGGLRAMIKHAFALSGCHLEQSKLEELFAETVEDYDRNIAVDTVLYPGVRGSLEAFQVNGWLLAVCTNKPIKQATKLLDELNIAPHFVAVTGVDSFEFKKPDPRHLTRTIELAGGRTDLAVMVGDTITDILAAQNAGIPVVAVDFGYSDVHVKTLAPDRVISSFDDLYSEATSLII